MNHSAAVSEKHYDAQRQKTALMFARAVTYHAGLAADCLSDDEEGGNISENEPPAPPRKPGPTNKSFSDHQRKICLQALAPDNKMPSVTTKALEETRKASPSFNAVYERLLRDRENNHKKVQNSIYKPLNSYFKTQERRAKK